MAYKSIFYFCTHHDELNVSLIVVFVLKFTKLFNTFFAQKKKRKRNFLIACFQNISVQNTKCTHI